VKEQQDFILITEEPTIDFYNVTPEFAGFLYELPAHNRKLPKNVSDEYGEDMENGLWLPISSGLDINRNGERMNGENRLKGCIRSGVPFVTSIATGLDPRARFVIDSGVDRRPGHYLRMFAGCSYRPRDVAALIKVLYLVENGRVNELNNGEVLKDEQYVTAYFANPGLEDSVRIGVEIQRVIKGPTRLYAAAHYLWSAENESLGDKALAVLGDPTERAEEFLPVVALRDYIKDNIDINNGRFNPNDSVEYWLRMEQAWTELKQLGHPRRRFRLTG